MSELEPREASVPAKGAADDGAPAPFSSSEKLLAVFGMAQVQLEEAPPLMRRLFALTSRFGLLEPLWANLPAWDDAAGWDELLELLAGLALELRSDGAELDVAAARRDAGSMLVRMFERVDVAAIADDTSSVDGAT